MADQDTELTLSTGKLLGFFFGMVVVCGIFFSLGYLVGKGSSQAGAPVMTDSAMNSNISSSGGAKPSAGRFQAADTTAKPCATSDASCTTPATAESAAISTVPASNDPNASKNARVAGSAVLNTASKPEQKSAVSAVNNTPPELTNNSLTGFMVQVAAVSKQEDADALVKALRKKEYPVFVVPQADNKLFHVQVGPFAQQKDAEAMRARLAGDGYNAILKK